MKPESHIYAATVERWRRVWPLLQILPWDGVGVAGIRRVLQRDD